MKKRLFIVLAIFFSIFPLFSATMDARVRKVPKEIADAVFKKPKDNLDALVQNLTAGLGSADAKVKVIHDWICDNIAYDSEMYFSGRISKQDSVNVLKKKKAVCSGYSNLMRDMCALAGVEAIVIDGYSKGFGYAGYLREKTDHAWNAVKLSKGWQLIDVTWDAGYLDWRTYIKCYTTQWYSLTPAQFIYSHLPEKDEFQYLPEEKRRTKEQFVKEPYIAGVFFEKGLSLGKNAPNYTNEIAGATLFDFNSSKSTISVMSDLIDKDTSEIVKNATWIDHTGIPFSVNVDIPESKTYRARLLARPQGAIENPRHFEQAEFEGEIIPRVEQLLAEKKITQAEKDYFDAAFFKVEDNRRYYPAEDLFATARNNAVTKILKLLEKNTGSYDEVMYFDVTAASGYAGYGADVLRFPTAYRSYGETANTHLISPTNAVLHAGEEVKFEVKTKDFAALGVVINGNLEAMTKNAKTGAFEMSLTLPAGVEKLDIMGSKNGKNFFGLWFYFVQ